MGRFFKAAKEHEELRKANERLTERHRNLYVEFQRALDENVSLSKEVHDLRRTIHAFHTPD